jgi:hypothetical protein
MKANNVGYRYREADLSYNDAAFSFWGRPDISTRGRRTIGWGNIARAALRNAYQPIVEAQKDAESHEGPRKVNLSGLEQQFAAKAPNPFDQFAWKKRESGTALELANDEFLHCAAQARDSAMLNWAIDYKNNVKFHSTVSIGWSIVDGGGAWILESLITGTVGGPVGFAAGLGAHVIIHTAYDSVIWSSDADAAEARARWDYIVGLSCCIRAVGEKYGIWFVPTTNAGTGVSGGRMPQIFFEPTFVRPKYIFGSDVRFKQ